MASNAYLPANPTNGQVFIDASNAKWIFNRELDVWERSGTVETIPVATDTIVGLFKSADKVMLDGTNAAPGGFGIIVDPLAGTPARPDGIVSGDIRLVSDSIDVTCVDDGEQKGLVFSVSPEFLETFCLNQSPTPGPDGDKGAKGGPGPDGDPPFAYSDGPVGDTGADGKDAEACNLVDVRLNDLPGTTDTPIVSMRMVEDADTGACQLLFTKAKVDVGGSDGNSIVATPISRGLNYPPDESTCSLTRLANWELLKPSGDPTPLDLQLVRLAKNKTNDGKTAINAYPLTSFIDDVVSHYQTKLATLDETWQQQVKEHVIGKDTAARTILSELADQLAQCEFKIPAEFCLDIEKCEPNPAAQIRPFVVPAPKNHPCCCWDAPSIGSDFGLWVGQGYGGGAASNNAENRPPASIVKVRADLDLGPIWPVWTGEIFAGKAWTRINAKNELSCGGAAGRQTGMAFQCYHITRPTRVAMELRGQCSVGSDGNLGAIKIVSCSSLFQGDKQLPEITEPYVDANGINNTGLSDANLRRYLLAYTECSSDDWGPHTDRIESVATSPGGWTGDKLCDVYRHTGSISDECEVIVRYKKTSVILQPGNYVLIYFANWDVEDNMSGSYWSYWTSLTSQGCA